jgi:hypothetical protein
VKMEAVGSSETSSFIPDCTASLLMPPRPDWD